MKYRAIFISDVHLAARSCKAAELLSFLEEHDAPTLFLVGDIVDFWRLRRGPHWTPAQTQVVRALLSKAQNGRRIIYIPGNHDDEMRALAGSMLGPIEVRLTALHKTAAGRRFLVLHGDEFDSVMKKARWLAILGDIAYDFAMSANGLVNVTRRAFGLPHWSLSAYLKHKAKRAVNSFASFEAKVASEALKRGATGVICGHVHHASMHRVNAIDYVNTGDWVESGTAVVEHLDGRLEIIRWVEMLRAQQVRLKPTAAIAS